MPNAARAAEAPEGLASAEKHFPELDGVRGMAILLVLLHHFTVLKERHPFDAIVGAALGACWVGVDLFFVLSGFLITGILWDSKGDGRYYRNFYARRALRIFPLYYGFVALLVWVMPRVVGGYSQQIDTLRANQVWLWTYTTNILVGLRQDWTAAVPSANHFWSLAVEEQFYLVWPMVVAGCSRRQLLRTCCAMIVAAPLIRAALVLAGDAGFASYVLTPARMDSLAVGGLVALAMREPASRRLALRLSRPVLLASAAALVAAFCWRLEFYPNNPFVAIAGYSLVAFLFGALLVRVVGGEGTARRIFAARSLGVLGLYSYAIYVFHPSVRRVLLDYALKGVSFPTLFGSEILKDATVHVLGIGAVLALGWTSWQLYERHFLKLKSRFPHRSARAAA